MNEKDLPLNDTEKKVLILFSAHPNPLGKGLTKLLIQHGLLRKIAEKLKEDIERAAQLPEAKLLNLDEKVNQMVNNLKELITMTNVFDDDEDKLIRKQAKYN